MIITGDSLEVLKTLKADSIDLIATDPPYGYSFMGKDWDKAVPSVDIWRECLRVLKAGAFCYVMSAPRSDVQNAMISRLMQAGFRLDFTPIYWTYASGFPKAGNIGKLVDKRLGAEREVIDTYKIGGMKPDRENFGADDRSGGKGMGFRPGDIAITQAATPQAKALDGSYAGFQPKPAVEVIIVAMKPLSEKTYVDQALKNGKGITWLDDCRIPTDSDITTGRFPANLLVSDDVLNDGVVYKTGNVKPYEYKGGGNNPDAVTPMLNVKRVTGTHTGDSGSYSRYFDLDKWATTLPFLAVPKASKGEKNKGLEHMDDRVADVGDERPSGSFNERLNHPTPKATKNHHPTVKPLKLMSYLITLGSRAGDTVLDPFVGSGTTVVAAQQLGRNGIGIEREEEYAEIARARVAHLAPAPLPAEPTTQPPVTVDDVLDSQHDTKPEQLTFI